MTLSVSHVMHFSIWVEELHFSISPLKTSCENVSFDIFGYAESSQVLIHLLTLSLFD